MNALDVSFDDLPENQRDLAEAIGMEAFICLTKVSGGDSPYVMLYSELERIAMNKQLINEFDGRNYKQLASKYGYSISTVRKKNPKELRKGGVRRGKVSH